MPIARTFSTQLYMPFDNTPGYSTGIALTNPSSPGSSPATVNVSLLDASGDSLASGIVVVPANGHVSKVLSDLFADIAGKRGTVSLTSDSGIFALGIRANGVAFTTLKVIAPSK